MNTYFHNRLCLKNSNCIEYLETLTTVNVHFTDKLQGYPDFIFKFIYLLPLLSQCSCGITNNGTHLPCGL
jgi:hypothetical protein